MDSDYDTSWDWVESEEGYLPINADAWNRKCQEWRKRDWVVWLRDNLTFPFWVTLEEDDEACFDKADHEPFQLGHTMKVLDLEAEDDQYGIILKVREGRRVGYVSLMDVAVQEKDHPNYWPMREYVAWFATIHADPNA